MRFKIRFDNDNLCICAQAETSDDVKRCNVSIYLRVKDAQACQVSSTVLLPLFSNELRNRPVAVLEVTQFTGGTTSYEAVFAWARKHLEVYISQPSALAILIDN